MTNIKQVTRWVKLEGDVCICPEALESRPPVFRFPLLERDWKRHVSTAEKKRAAREGKAN